MWFRWHEGTTKDPKFGTVATKTKQPVAIVLAVWATLLEHASQQDGDGSDPAESRGGIAGYDCEDIDELLRIESGVTATILDAFAQKGMVQDRRIVRWEKRQPKKEDPGAAARKRESREKQKEKQEPEAGGASHSDADCPDASHDVTDGHAASRRVTTEQNRVEQSRTEKKKDSGAGGAKSAAPPDTAPSEDPVEPPLEKFRMTYALLAEGWNKMLVPLGLSRASPKSDARQKKLATRLKEDRERESADWWLAVFSNIAQSDWLLGKIEGRNGRPFNCTLGWLLEREENLLKVAEGAYLDRDVAPALPQPEYVPISDEEDGDFGDDLSQRRPA